MIKHATIVSISETTSKEDTLTIVKNLHKIERRNFLRVGKLLKNAVVESGYNGEDFVRNRRSFRIGYDCYRIPRFLKTRLLKRI